MENPSSTSSSSSAQTDLTTKKRSCVKNILISLVALYIVIFLGATIFQRTFIYFAKNNDIKVSEELQPWHLNNVKIGFCREVQNPKHIWLFSHGNAAQAGERDYMLKHIEPSDSIYLIEYPGFGKRPGSPTQTSLNEAVTEAYQALRQQFPNIPVGAIGESLGSGPTSHLATLANPPDKIVLLVPYDAIVNVAKYRLPILPVNLLIKDRWDNIAALQNYKAPLEIYGAENDSVIPCRLAQNLAKNLPQATFHLMPGGHLTWSKKSDPMIRFP